MQTTAQTTAATPRTGLTASEVAARAARGLRNVLPRGQARSVAGILRGNLASGFTLTIFGMAAVLAGLSLRSGDLRPLFDAVAISGLALLNGVVGVVQEVRAKRALDRISALARSACTVLRDGVLAEVAQDQIVEGDLIRISRGDPIPVDGAIVESRSGHCEVDESLLTGESESVEKPVGAPVRSGSFCVAGEALLVAEKVGAESYLHGVVRDLKVFRIFKTPLQRDIDRIVRILVLAAGVLVVLVVAQAVARVRLWPALPDEPGGGLGEVIDVARSVAAIVTSMVPMGLVLLSTVAFSLGVLRISRKGALVQKLNAVESFSHVDVLCMDKTGTLTRNQLRLRTATPLPGGDEAALRALAGAFAHRCTEQNGTVHALRRDTPDPAPGVTVVDEVPFNSRDKWSGLALRTQGGAERRLVLGALEVLAARLPAEQRDEARRVVAAAPGLRHVLLAEAQGPLAGASPLALAGVLSLSDEVRPDAPAVLQAFAARGIALKIFSGDAAETVRAVAVQAGWPTATAAVVTGPQLDAMTPAELSSAAAAGSLFARVSPHHKRALVQALQGQGRYVAMVGDGVNDVLALKEAHLGIAMGAGSRMARDVSDLVLLGNDFALLPEVLSEGAGIVANVETAAKLFLTKNAFSLTLVLGTGFLGLAFPFVPRHVSVLNLFAITLPATLITFSRRGAEARAGRALLPVSFLREVLRFSGLSGGLIGLGALGSFFLSLVALGGTEERARTVLLTQLVLLASLNFLLVVGGAQPVANLRRSPLLALFPLAFSGLYLGLLFGLTQTESLSWVVAFLEVERLTKAEFAVTLGMTAVAGAAMVWAQHRAQRSPGPPLKPSR